MAAPVTAAVCSAAEFTEDEVVASVLFCDVVVSSSSFCTSSSVLVSFVALLMASRFMGALVFAFAASVFSSAIETALSFSVEASEADNSICSLM